MSKADEASPVQELVMPRWERGVRVHGFWIENTRVGHVGLGPTGDHWWELDGTQEHGQAFSLRAAKRLVKQAYLRHNAAVHRRGPEDK